jgi:predicted transcriptional regulator of viral defense system
MLQEKLLKAFVAENGILTIEKAKEYNLTGEALRKAFLRGDISRDGRGLYVLSDEYSDDLIRTQYRFQRGIYSHQTALMLHQLSSFSPFYYYMTFPFGYNSKDFQEARVRPTFSTKGYYDIGIEEVETWFGNKVKVYNKERTIIDLFRSNSMDDLVEEVLENYFLSEDKNLDLLANYAVIFGKHDLVKKEVKRYA